MFDFFSVSSLQHTSLVSMIPRSMDNVAWGEQGVPIMLQSNSSLLYVYCPAARVRKIWLIVRNWCAKDKTRTFFSLRWTDPFILLNPFSVRTVYPELLSSCFAGPLRSDTNFTKTNSSSWQRRLQCAVAELKDFVYKQHLQGGLSAPRRESPLSLFWKQLPAHVSQQQLVTCACFSSLPTTSFQNPESCLSLSTQMKEIFQFQLKRSHPSIILFYFSHIFFPILGLHPSQLHFLLFSTNTIHMYRQYSLTVRLCSQSVLRFLKLKFSIC